MIKVSVGPASKSMPTRPKSCRFASATYALPGPTSMSTAGIEAVPSPIAAIACTPPRMWTSSAPPNAIAATVAAGGAPFSGGVQATIRFTPATFAVSTLICADATIG